MLPVHNKHVIFCLFGGFLLLGLLLITGCMADSPNETDLPWNAPDERDGMMPLPSSMMNRYN